MPRPRRTPDKQGRLLCTKCKELKHISAYYCAAGAHFCVTNAETGIDEWYGKPLSWCRACVSAYGKDQRAADKAREREMQERLFATPPTPTAEEEEDLSWMLEPRTLPPRPKD